MFDCFRCCFGYKISDMKVKNLDLKGVSGNFYVCSVYDGDTIKIIVPLKVHVFDMNGPNSIVYNSNSNKTDIVNFHEIKVRLAGIDSPELKTDVNGFKSRDYLMELVLDKIVRVEILGQDKYGRFLGNIYCDTQHGNQHVNKLMIEQGYAVEYYGKTKPLHQRLV